MFGRVIGFTHGQQDHARHKVSDSNEGARRHVQFIQTHVIDAGKALRRLYDRQAHWPEVKNYLAECVL